MVDVKNKKSIIVYKQIIDDIKAGKINRGDTLPSEAELCRMYDVGRGSIREALHVLEALGLVRKQVGIGSIVQDFSLESIFNPAGLMFDLDHNNLKQVLDFRNVFELIVIKMLEGAITEEDIERLEEILTLEKLYHKRKNIEKFSEYDYKFHQALAEATHNIVMISIFHMINPFLKYIISQTINMPDNFNNTIIEHSKILQAIKSKNMKDAEKIIKTHISKVQEFFNVFMQKDKSFVEIEHKVD